LRYNWDIHYGDNNISQLYPNYIPTIFTIIRIPICFQDFHLAREKYRAASVGATGHALIAALALEAEASRALGDAATALELLRRVRSNEEALHGAESADCCALEDLGDGRLMDVWGDVWGIPSGKLT
jgi:hypothetical protein